MALAVADEGILARVLQPHRPPGLLGEQREIDLDGQVLLAAEAAAHQRAAHADLVVRHAEGVGDGPEVLDHLGRDADVDHVVLVHPGEAHLRLQEGVLLERRFVGVLDDQVGPGEARLGIALLDLALGDDVVARRRPGARPASAPPGCRRRRGSAPARTRSAPPRGRRCRGFPPRSAPAARRSSAPGPSPESAGRYRGAFALSGRGCRWPRCGRRGRRR